MSENNTEGLTCKNPECKIAETGKCIEGLPISECPFRQEGIEDARGDDLVAHSEEPAEEIIQSDIPVAHGKMLEVEEATKILCSGHTRVLCVIGPLDSGKTTFGLSLYSAFQHGLFEYWGFGGSRTLVAFEKRCHLSRAECGKSTPDTGRTSMRDGLGFLHLSLQSEETGSINLLISDRSGEFYERVANNLEGCEGLYELFRADLVIFFLDGAKLAGDDRHGVKSDLLMLAETLIEEGVLGKAHKVGIVLTKYDVVLGSEIVEQVEKDFDAVVKDFQGRFGPNLSGIKGFRIAARPENDTLQPRHGVLEIIEECMQPRNCFKIEDLSQPRPKRSFLRLKIADGGAT